MEALSAAQGIDAYPIVDDLARTVELIAISIQTDPEADWNAFWSDADDLFDKDCGALVGKRVLLGNDGQLHGGGTSDCTVFFIPRRGVSDDEEIENENDVKEIPSTLGPFVAFLSDQIQIYEEKNGRLQQTRARKLLLDSKLVSPFRREDILNDVLASRTPTLAHIPGQQETKPGNHLGAGLAQAAPASPYLTQKGRRPSHPREEKSLGRDQVASLHRLCLRSWHCSMFVQSNSWCSGRRQNLFEVCPAQQDR